TVLGLFVGTVIDRFDVRRTALACEAASMLIAAAMAALTLMGAITAWQIYALSAAFGVVAALDGPARHALVFQMVRPEDLPNAVALMSSLGTMSRVLGPAIGGVVLAFAGAGAAFAFNAATYLAIIAALILLDTSSLLRMPRDREASVLSGTVDSLRFVRRSR